MSSPHRFVVRRQVYTPPDVAGVRRLLPEKHERVATYPKAEAAFADCAARLAEFRRTTNPFQLGGACLFYQTNLPPFALHDYLLDHGITPPPTSLNVNPNYVFWWVKNSRTFTDREREAVWSACDKLTPFDVIEEDDRKAVHVVVELATRPINPTPEDYDICTHATEGGYAVRCEKKLSHALQVAGERDQALSDFFGEQLFLTDVQSFSSVARVPVGTGVVREAIHLGVRQSYATPHGGYEVEVFPQRRNAQARVPLMAFADERSAHADRDHRTSKARRTVNPFALAWSSSVHLLALCDSEPDAELPNGMTPVEVLGVIRRLATIPPPEREPTAEWYDRVVQWSPEFVDVIWATFADFRLFEVIEVPLG